MKVNNGKEWNGRSGGKFIYEENLTEFRNSKHDRSTARENKYHFFRWFTLQCRCQLIWSVKSKEDLKKNNQRKKKNGIWLRILLVREKIEANESFLMEREGKREDCESSGVEGFR